MKNHYHTFTWTALLLIGFFVCILLVWATAVDDHNKKVDSLLVSQYNFSERECVYVDDSFGQQFWINFQNNTIEQLSNCKLYCHTKQISNGQDCKTEEITRFVKQSCNFTALEEQKVHEMLDKISANLTSDERLFVDYMVRGQISIELTLKQEGGAFVCGNEEKYNQTTCTPTYKTLTTFCATPDEIEKARGLIA